MAPSPAAARARQSSPRDRCLRCRTPIQNLNATVARCEGRTFRPHRIHSSPQMQPRCPPCHCHCRCHCCCFPPHYHCHLQTAPHAHTCTRTCTRMHAYTKMKNNEDRKPRWSRVGGGGKCKPIGEVDGAAIVTACARWDSTAATAPRRRPAGPLMRCEQRVK